MVNPKEKQKTVDEILNLYASHVVYSGDPRREGISIEEAKSELSALIASCLPEEKQHSERCQMFPYSCSCGDDVDSVLKEIRDNLREVGLLNET